MLTDTEFLPYCTADIIVAAHINISTDILSPETYGIKAAVVDFIFAEIAVLKISNELRMTSGKRKTVRIHEIFPVGNKGVKLIGGLLVNFIILRYMGVQEL